MKWSIIIYDAEGGERSIPLDHEYATEAEAAREAECIADQEFLAEDDAWVLIPEKE